MTVQPRLALVPGEPAGIGPELCVRLVQRAQPVPLVAIADGDMLREAAARLGLPLLLRDESDAAEDPRDARPGTLRLRHVPRRVPSTPGVLDIRNADYVHRTLIDAADAALRGDVAGMVTGPVHKGVLNDAGIAYTGTTELLARHAGCEVVMMLASRTLRVALATTHLPLRAVPDAITRAGLERSLRIVHAALVRDVRLPSPRIAVLGLNPHAGEGGHLGFEEIETIRPVIELLRSEGIDLIGPLPADTAFLPSHLARCDAVFAMYHDQGLPVLKHAGFEQAVNITLGLPYVRVAVDHGTALDLAGKGIADASSLLLACEIAAEMTLGRGAR